MANSWVSLGSLPTISGGFKYDTMLLLTDGSVLVHNAGGNQGGKEWFRLTPDINGNYATGSWSGVINMINTRQFFASGILRDGRVFALGGEYSDAGSPTSLGEIFDPLTNTWSAMSKPSSFSWLNGDVSACILADGRVLFGALTSNRTALWDPRIDDWREAGLAFGASLSPTKVGTIDEETWVLLPDGSVLTVDISATPRAEKYVPETDQWVAADLTPATLTQRLALMNLSDTTVNPPVSINISEIGPAVVLPDGRVFFVGGTGHTSLYTQGASPSLPGSWTAGPDLPADTSGSNFNSVNGNIRTAIDAPAVLLPGGRVLCVAGNTVREVSSTGAVSFWSNPCVVYVYDPAANTFSQLAPQPPSAGVDVWRARFLLLPTGQVLFTDQTAGVLALLTVDTALLGAPNAAWRPTITGFPGEMAAGRVYSLSGTQFNGLSQACSYGDDAQMATNYPIFRMTNTSSHEVTYLRSFEFSTLGIATGMATVSASVQVPADMKAGQYGLVAIANGIDSAAVTVHVSRQSLFLIVDRSTYGQGEIQALINLNGTPAQIEPALYVVVDGYKPSELGLNGGNLGNPPHRPTVINPTSGISFEFSGPVIPQDPTLPDHAQRFTFPYRIVFQNADMFNFPNPAETLPVAAGLTISGVTIAAGGTILLIKNPNPYILDGDVAHGKEWYLSMDIRVFQIKAGQRKFAATVPSSGPARTAATSFIQQVLTNLNGSPASAAGLFESIPMEEDAESLCLAPTDAGGTPVYNFAIARVRMRDISAANDMRVFFRLWPAQQTEASYNTSTLYRAGHNASGQRIPLLGVVGDEIMTIPFFASPRINTGSASMNSQTDTPNVRIMNPDALGGEVYAYFGCWLDINQPGEQLFPARMLGGNPANRPDGPYTGMGSLLSIQQLVRSEHQCLLAEIAFDPDPIPTNADPATTDKLAQRNLAFSWVPNPGMIESRRAPQIFEIRPTPFSLNRELPNDEMMIQWGDIPVGSEAEIYLPDAGADEILEMADQIYSAHRLTKVDDHTLRCATGGVTYIPIPRRMGGNYAGLMTIDLPPTVKKGNVHKVVVKQITGALIRGSLKDLLVNRRGDVVRGKQAANAATLTNASFVEGAAASQNFNQNSTLQWRRVLGVFQLTIPVSTKQLLLAPEERRLSLMRWILLTIPVGTRWYLPFLRYIEQLVGRVREMGGDPDLVGADSNGDWNGSIGGHGKGHGHGHEHDDDEHEEHEHGEHEHEEHEHEEHEEYEHEHGRGEQVLAFSGKVSGLIYDHFGDFAGFLLETEDGTRRYESREEAIEALAERALAERIPTVVYAERHEPRNPQSLVLKG